ncbi:MAG: ATP phosphoribosyltransferase regulatory subunit [Solirubrobacteraceae bacterium]|nr:ATP phosphoribosyltransferase regulatory subunit [Solirubrobacteraceae bacterium]
MTLPIPSGTRDVLPDEMRELRAIGDAFRGVFEAHGYGEVSTPALEYESVLAKGDLAGARPAYRVVDDHGDVLVLRSDMTVPIARVVASRYGAAEPPLRLWYLAHAYRQVRPRRGMSRELLQVGIELVGSSAPDGTAEALTVLCRGLAATGLRDFKVGVGDASLFPAVLAGLGVEDGARDRILHELTTHDFVGVEREVLAAGLDRSDAESLVALAQQRGGPEVLDSVPAAAAEAVAGMRDVLGLLDPDVAERVIFDLGLVRDLGYYTGAIFEVYDPALGVPLGGGGRYDDLLGQFGRPLPAVGFALVVDRLHMALNAEESA